MKPPEEVIVVVGAHRVGRSAVARDLSRVTGRVEVSAMRLAMVPDPVGEALALVGRARGAGAVVELPIEVDLAQTLPVLDNGTCRVRAVVCVVDAGQLLDDLHRGDDVALPLPGSTVRVRVARAMTTVAQIEYASALVLVGWRGVDAGHLAVVRAVLAHLAPQASVHLEGIDPLPVAGSGAGVPGWALVLRDTPVVLRPSAGVTGVRYSRLRPFRPGRLAQVLARLEDGRYGTVLRSAGLCRWASRSGQVLRWDHVGTVIDFSALGDGRELSPVGQDLLLVGIDLHAETLVDDLDRALLSDSELLAGPQQWAAYEEPLPLFVL